MSFDGSGTYDLPAGQPVVTGTTISSSTHNTWASDVATALSACLVNDGQQTWSGNQKINGKLLLLDVDQDTSIRADTDDQIDIKIAGVDLVRLVDGIYTLSDTDAGSAIGPILKIYRNSSSPADADFAGAIYFDGEDSAGNQDTFASLETQIDDVTTTTEDGTLLVKTMEGGTLTTQIDVSSAAVAITPPVTGAFDGVLGGNTPAAVTGTTLAATADTSAGDNAEIGYTAAEGLILTGQGSTNDITIKNDADADVITIATGTQIAAFAGVADFSAAGLKFDDETLDEYDEGTFTPVLSDGTNNATSAAGTGGEYIRVGNIVYVTGRIVISSLGSVSGAIRINGLPFTSKNSTPGTNQIYFSNAAGLAITASENVGGIVSAATADIDLTLWDASTGVTLMQGTEWTADGDASFGGWYLV